MDVDQSSTNDDEEEVPTVFRVGTFNDWTADGGRQVFCDGTPSTRLDRPNPHA